MCVGLRPPCRWLGAPFSITNTRRGLATGFNEEKGRYQVSLEAVPVPGLEFDCALLIKPDNLNVEVAVRVPAN